MLTINAILSIALLVGANSWAAEQVLDLKKGWNAVSLELALTEPDPNVLFAGKPIEIVSLWLPGRAKVLTLTDPAAVPAKGAEWHSWQPADSPAAFLNNLRSLPAKTPLLIKTSAACQVRLTGSAVYRRTDWIGSSFNLVGFDIDPLAPPTFARFFDGSRAHQELKIYQLVANRWRKVAPTAVMARGECYWVWCSEGSDFQGPVDLKLAGSGLSLSGNTRASLFSLRKNGQLPVTVTIALSDGFQGGLSREVEAGEQSQELTLSLTDAFTPSYLTLSDGAIQPGRWLLSVKGGGISAEFPVTTY